MGMDSFKKLLNLLEKYVQVLLISKSLRASSHSTEFSKLLSWLLNLGVGLLHFFT